MKYQIYLNKQTSEILEQISKIEGKRPASIIKGIVELLFMTSVGLAKKDQQGDIK